jgi:hypothetical protein
MAYINYHIFNFEHFSVVKHRMPSPVRQAGDGMEEIRSDKALKSDHRAGSSSDLKGQIRLPMTNISLDKLPPITDDKVRLPEASPATPLVKVSNYFLIFHSGNWQILWHLERHSADQVSIMLCMEKL